VKSTVLALSVAIALPLSTIQAGEVIGPVTVTATPASATLIVGGGPLFDWMNVVDAPVGLGSAFHGFPVLDDGFANPAPGTVIALHFGAGTLVNGPGPDVAVFDAHFDAGAYALSADATGFVVELPLPEAAFIPTGEVRSYYYPGPLGTGPSDAAIFVAVVDLSMLGVPPGAAVTTLHLKALNAGCDPVGVGSLTPQPPGAIVGGYALAAAPVEAKLVAGGGAFLGSMNLVEEALSVSDAFSGMPVADSGYGNSDADSIFELRFEHGALRNGPGHDLVVFEARYNEGAYALSTSHDGFAAELVLASGDFTDTLEDRDFFFFDGSSPTGPYPSDLFATPVDLSDLGVPADAVVERVQVRTLIYGCDFAGVGSLASVFQGDLAALSLSAGGTYAMSLAPGASRSGDTYLVLGSLSGSTPGFDLGALHVPLNIDPYFLFTLKSPGAPPLAGSLGVLDGAGHATCTLTLPPGTAPSLAGVTIHHAFGLLNLAIGGADYVSNAIELELLP
jgi:hypothetical protein